MTTKYLTTKFPNFPNYIVVEFLGKTESLDNSPSNFPLPDHLQNANFINIVLSRAHA